MTSQQSYAQILRASSIIGGAHGLSYLVGLVRVKIVAVLLGPAGVGLIGLYQSATALVGTVSGLGIESSGVRDVAKSFGEGDAAAAARTVHILRRMCWITGLLGWFLTALLARPLSDWVFGDAEHATAIALLGGTLLLGAISGGQAALVQGVRRIGDLARINVYAMLINTVLAIGLYAWLRQEGIVPVLIGSAAVSLAVSWWFARRIEVNSVRLNLRETFRGAKRLVGLGSALMWSGLLTAGLDMATRSLITREYGIEAAGFYQAAWALSGMFASFILGAMGSDFYPRLTSVIEDREQAIETVNQQTEVGILLALPGLLATLAFAPLAIKIFYSEAFLPGAALLPWFLLGVFIKIVSWPLGYILLAKGNATLYTITQTSMSVVQLSSMISLVTLYGFIGAAYSFALTYVFSLVANLWLMRFVIGFRWNQSVKQLLLSSTMYVLIGTFATLTLPGAAATWVPAVTAIIGGIASIRGLSDRLGEAHPLVRSVCKLPGSQWLIHSKPR